MSRIEKIIEMIAASGKDSFLQHALALEYIKIGNKEDALKQFIGLLTENPTYVGSYYHLGKLYESLGNVENVLTTIPRLNYNSVGGCPSLLLEPQRANLMNIVQK